MREKGPYRLDMKPPWSVTRHVHVRAVSPCGVGQWPLRTAVVVIRCSRTPHVRCSGVILYGDEDDPMRQCSSAVKINFLRD